jgi:hypothetical protein
MRQFAKASSLIIFMVLGMTQIASAASYEVKAKTGAENGWSKRADCEGNVGGKCVPAYFCSNDIWMKGDALDRLQAKRYDGEQLIIIRDGTPICAVN